MYELITNVVLLAATFAQTSRRCFPSHILHNYSRTGAGDISTINKEKMQGLIFFFVFRRST